MFTALFSLSLLQLPAFAVPSEIPVLVEDDESGPSAPRDLCTPMVDRDRRTCENHLTYQQATHAVCWMNFTPATCVTLGSGDVVPMPGMPSTCDITCLEEDEPVTLSFGTSDDESLHTTLEENEFICHASCSSSSDDGNDECPNPAEGVGFGHTEMEGCLDARDSAAMLLPGTCALDACTCDCIATSELSSLGE